MTYYKATRPDGTSYHDGTTKWVVGRITRLHPLNVAGRALCGPGVLHASTELGEVLVSSGHPVWPCALFEVEPRGELVTDPKHPYKVGCVAWKVTKKLEPWQAFGPNGKQVVQIIDRCRTFTADEVQRLVAAWNAARNAAWDAARDAARNAARNAAWDAAWDAARDAAWNAAWDAARDAALALLVRDLITPAQYNLLADPWESVMGKVFR